MDDARRLYLDLMRRALTNAIYPEGERWPVVGHSPWKRALIGALKRAGLELVRPVGHQPHSRDEGRGHPPLAHTMVGLKRLENVERAVITVIEEGVPGDLIETGVWRGGTTIFMRAILKAYGVTDRRVWVADSFAGLPPPDPRYPADRGDQHHSADHLAVSADEVRENFRRYGLLDEQVGFLEGFFAETLPRAPIERLALLRLDGDMYGSTIEALEALYPRLSPGGFVIVDDYGAVEGCRRAVEDYRRREGIVEPLTTIDWAAVSWRVPRDSP